MAKTSVSTANELLRAAVGMYDATVLIKPYIKPAGQDQPAVYVAYYLNLGFAVELLLKAYVRHTDPTANVAKFGHRLDDLMSEAERLDYPFKAPQMRMIVDILSESHEDHLFRYAEGSAEFPYINQLDTVEATIQAGIDGIKSLPDAIAI